MIVIAQQIQLLSPTFACKWVIKDEFHIHIPDNTGKLTNIRAATFYEEFHPHVITSIINRIWI